MFGGCMPVGCSYETKSEYEYLNYKLETQKATKNIAETLQNVFSKAKEELGWVAERGLDEMCEDTWRWQSGNPNGYAE